MTNKQVKPNQPSTKAKPKKDTPAKPRQKKISFKSIQEEQTKLNTMSSYVVHADTNHVIKYYKKFDVVKIRELLTTAYESLIYVQENKINFFKTDEQFINYIHFLIIYKFTHFGDEIGKTFEDHIEAMNMLISLGYYKIILDEILDPEEVYNVIVTMKDFIEAAGLAIEADMKEKEKMLKELSPESDFIKSKLGLVNNATLEEDEDNGE